MMALARAHIEFIYPCNHVNIIFLHRPHWFHNIDMPVFESQKLNILDKQLKVNCAKIPGSQFIRTR